MTCTTFLHNSELNQKLPTAECQYILDEVRKATGKDIQVVPYVVTKRKWFSTHRKTLYGLYIYVGGIGPWQQINFYSMGTKTSLNLYVELDVVMAYLLGCLCNR